MSDDLRDASQRKLSFLQTLKAVGWGCSACARARATRKTAPGSTRYVIVAGLLARAVFVGVLILIVRWAVSSLT